MGGSGAGDYNHFAPLVSLPLCVFHLGRLHVGEAFKRHSGACGRKHGVAGLSHLGPGSRGRKGPLEVPAFPSVAPRGARAGRWCRAGSMHG